MQKEIIKLEHPTFKRERYFTTLTFLCEKINSENEAKVLSYHVIKKESFPFEYNGYNFSKVEVERKIKSKIEKRK